MSTMNPDSTHDMSNDELNHLVHVPRCIVLPSKTLTSSAAGRVLL